MVDSNKGQLLQNALDPLGTGEPPQLVFSANSHGDMTSATAKLARSFYATGRCSGGWRGKGYGILIGRSSHDVFPIMRLEQQYYRFFDLAKRNPGTLFQLPRIGAGQRSGSPEYESYLAKLAFHKAPSNVLLPGTWIASQRPLCRLFAYADPAVELETVCSILDAVVGPKINRLGNEVSEVIFPPRTEGAARAIAYAKHLDIPYRLLSHPISKISRSDTLITGFIWWYATDAIFIYDSAQASPQLFDLYHYADWALKQRLNVRYIDVQQAKFLL